MSSTGLVAKFPQVFLKITDSPLVHLFENAVVVPLTWNPSPTPVAQTRFGLLTIDFRNSGAKTFPSSCNPQSSCSLRAPCCMVRAAFISPFDPSQCWEVGILSWRGVNLLPHRLHKPGISTRLSTFAILLCKGRLPVIGWPPPLEVSSCMRHKWSEGKWAAGACSLCLAICLANDISLLIRWRTNANLCEFRDFLLPVLVYRWYMK